jgi:hypothetical protein
MFLKTRAKSAGEKIQLKIQDPDDLSFSADYEINVDKIGVKKQKEHTDMIQMTETMFVKMRYPDINFFNEGIDISRMDSQFDIVARCISQIIDGEEVYQATDMVSGELEEWLDDLTSENFKKITNFFETMPKLSHTITMRNTNTDKDFTVTLEGLADFF